MRHFDPKELTVITPITNPLRFRSRHRLYQDFEKQMLDAGVNFITVETAFGRRPYHFTQENDINDVQLRTDHELWLKEKSINVAFQYAVQAYPKTKYFAWIDGDIQFQDPHWAEETVEWLQHYQVLQMFSQCIDLGPNGEHLNTLNGFMYQWVKNDFKLPPRKDTDPLDYYNYFSKDPAQSWHPGFAWAIRRDSLDSLGGLIDLGILGSGDRHMCLALVGAVDRSYHPHITAGYKEPLHLWQDRALKYVRRDVGYLPTLILHNWHGKKVDRKYGDRWKILVRNKYDPRYDLKLDSQGLYQLTDRNWRLRVEIEAYFKARREDSIDL